MPLTREEVAELRARQVQDSQLATAKVAEEIAKNPALTVRECIENREDGWYLVVFSEDRRAQTPIAEYGPYKTDANAEGTQARYWLANATKTETANNVAMSERR